MWADEVEFCALFSSDGILALLEWLIISLNVVSLTNTSTCAHVNIARFHSFGLCCDAIGEYRYCAQHFPCRQIKTQGVSGLWVHSPPPPPPSPLLCEWKSQDSVVFEQNIQMKCTHMCVPVSIRYAHHIAIICHPRRWVVVTETFTVQLQCTECRWFLCDIVVISACYWSLFSSIPTALCPIWRACTYGILCNVLLRSKPNHPQTLAFILLARSLPQIHPLFRPMCSISSSLLGKKHSKRAEYVPYTLAQIWLHVLRP